MIWIFQRWATTPALNISHPSGFPFFCHKAAIASRAVQQFQHASRWHRECHSHVTKAPRLTPGTLTCTIFHFYAVQRRKVFFKSWPPLSTEIHWRVRSVPWNFLACPFLILNLLIYRPSVVTKGWVVQHICKHLCF